MPWTNVPAGGAPEGGTVMVWINQAGQLTDSPLRYDRAAVGLPALRPLLSVTEVPVTS